MAKVRGAKTDQALKLLAEGKTPAEVARTVGISSTWASRLASKGRSTKSNKRAYKKSGPSLAKPEAGLYFVSPFFKNGALYLGAGHLEVR